MKKFRSDNLYQRKFSIICPPIPPPPGYAPGQDCRSNKKARCKKATIKSNKG